MLCSNHSPFQSDPPSPCCLSAWLCVYLSLVSASICLLSVCLFVLSLTDNYSSYWSTVRLSVCTLTLLFCYSFGRFLIMFSSCFQMKGASYCSLSRFLILFFFLIRSIHVFLTRLWYQCISFLLFDSAYTFINEGI